MYSGSGFPLSSHKYGSVLPSDGLPDWDPGILKYLQPFTYFALQWSRFLDGLFHPF